MSRVWKYLIRALFVVLFGVAIFSFTNVALATHSTYSTYSQNFGVCPPPPDNFQQDCISVSGGASGGIASFSVSSRIDDGTPGDPTLCPTAYYSGLGGASSWSGQIGCGVAGRGVGGPGDGGTTVYTGAGGLEAGFITWTIPYSGEPDSICYNISWGTVSGSGSTTACVNKIGTSGPRGSMIVAGPEGPTSTTVGNTETYSATFTWSGLSAQGKLELFDSNFSLVQSRPWTSLSFSPQGLRDSFSFNTAGNSQVCATGEATDESGLIAQDSQCLGVTVVAPLAVDIKANDSDGPITITYNTSATLSWRHDGPSGRACTSFSDPDDPNWPDNTPVTQPSGSTQTSNRTVSTTYGLTCTGSTVSDTVRVGVASPSFTLTVSKAGTGSGTVTDTGINCGSDCTEVYTQGTSVTLTATPASGSSFGSWSGCDSSNNNLCTVTMNANRTVTVLFDVLPETLSVDLRAKQTGTTWSQSLSGEAPFNGVDLRADVAGTAQGTINYTFYCNRSDSGTTVTSPWDAKFDGISSTNQNVENLCDYPSPGSYTAKVIVERGSLASENRVSISVSPRANRPPSATNLSVTPGGVCSAPLQPTFSWTFSDPDGDSQSSYQVQVDNSSGFDSPEVDTGRVNSSSTAYTVPAGALSFNTTYNWQVRVWDSGGAVSNYTRGPDFTTPVHAGPNVNFSWAPVAPLVNETTQFADQSQVFGGASISSWLWAFQNGNPGSSVIQNPQTKFTSQGTKTVTLTVTDSDSIQCSTSKNVEVGLPVPEFKEVRP